MKTPSNTTFYRSTQYTIDKIIQCYEDIVSSSLSFPFTRCVLEGKELMAELETVEGESTLGELTSCHAGIVGLPRRGIGEDGALGTVGPRLRSKAFNDFNSC